MIIAVDRQQAVIQGLAVQAAQALAANCNLSLVLPRPWPNRPAGFPRGELLNVAQDGKSAVYSFKPFKLLLWLHKNGLVQIKLTDKGKPV